MKPSQLITKGFSIASVTVIGLAFLFAFAVRTDAAINPQINYQGKLTNRSNVAVPDGSYNIQFNLYTAASGGSAIWTETRTGANRVTITGGIFSAMLGSVNSLAGIDFNQTLYLGVTIGGSGVTPTWDPEMSPRKVLGAVPAAFVAQRLEGLTVTTGKLASINNSITLSGTDSTSFTFPASSGTVAITGNNLGVFAATTSLQFAGVISDETGSGGNVVLSMNPTLSGLTMADNTNIVLNANIGTRIGTATNQKLGFFNATPVVQPSGNVMTALSTLGLVASPSLADADIPDTITINGTNNVSWASVNHPTTISGYGITDGLTTATSFTGGDIASGTYNSLSLVAGITRDTEWDTAAKINAATTDADFSLTTHTHSALSQGTGIASFSYNGGSTATVALDYAATLAGNPILTANLSSFASTGIIFEGSTADLIEGLLTVANPTGADVTWTLPNASGTVVVAATSTTTTQALFATATAGAPAYRAIADGDIPNNITIDAATSATNATNFGITNDTTTNATMYPLWVTANTGNLPARVTSTKLSYNPSTGVLTSTGGFAGNASTATALATDPSDCGANNFATSIGTNGNLGCASIADADIPDTITINGTNNVSWASVNHPSTISGYGITDGLTTATSFSGGDIASGVYNSISLVTGITRDTEWDTAAEINAATTDADFSLTTHGHTSISGYATNIRSGEATDLNAVWTAPGTNLNNALYVYNYIASAANKPASIDNANWVMSLYSHASGGVASYGHQIAGADSQDLYFRRVQNGSFSSWSKLWHTDNDGSGSTLDADTLDGHDTSYFQIAGSYLTTSTSFTGGDITSGTYNSISLITGITRDTEWDTAAEINAATTDADFSLTTHTHTYDNYQYWTLQGSGADGSNVTSGTTINLTGGGSTTVTKAGNTVTISSAGFTNPMTTLGDIIYGGASGVPTRLAGAAGFLKSTGAAAPAWSSITDADIPNNITIDAATSATNATNFGITNDTTTNATMYPVWVTANTGNLPARVTSTKLSYNPSTGVLTSTGGFSGNASTASALATNPTDCAANTFATTIAANGNLTCASITDADVPDTITLTNITQITTRNHHDIQGLTDDDHSIYALLAGRAGGQSLIGGNAVNNVLTLQATSASGNTTTNAAIQMKVGDAGGTTAMTVFNNGNVAVGGTVAASGRLHVYGDGTNPALFVNGGDSAGILLLGSTSSSSGNGIRMLGSSTNGGTSSIYSDYYSSEGALVLGTYSNRSNQLFLATNGSIGIGNVSPGAKLDVSGAIRTNNQLISTVASGTAPLSVSSNTVVSNLNADLLDGNHSSNFLDTSSSSQTKSGDLTVNNMTANRYYQNANGVPTNNLGTPSVTEMALFDEQFNNKTAFYNINNLKFYTYNGTTWTEYTGFSDTDKRRLLGGDGNSNIAIPNLTQRFRVELVNDGNYVFLNALYAYWSSNSHNTQVQIWKRDYATQIWSQVTSSSQTVSSWPGHLYLPFTTVPFASTYHNDAIRIEFIPTWSGDPTYGSQPISLYKMQIWGGYPAGKRDIYSTDEYRNIIFPANLSTGSYVGVGNTSPGALLDVGTAGSTAGVIRMAGGTSGTVTINVPAVAGSNTITLPAATGTVALTSNPTLSGLTMADGTNISLGTTTGTRIGTATTQKLGFFNAAPVVQPTGNIMTALTNLGLVASPSLADADIPNNITIDAATSATNATNIGITNDTTTNATMYPVWVTANTGNLPAKVTSTKLSFNPSTGVLTVSGGVAGNASTASALATNPTDCAANTFATTIAANGNLTCASITDADVPDTITLTNITQISTRNHHDLQGLTDDDHTQYALLAGRAGGQTLIGGTAANNILTLQANSASAGNTTSNAAIQFKVGNSGGTTAMTILNNGDVGIGTTPAKTLHIYNSSVAAVRLERGANSGWASLDYTPAGALSASNTSWGSGLIANSNSYTIWNNNGSTDTNRMLITNDGNVGIGTTGTPGARLEVNGNILVPQQSNNTIGSNTAGILFDGTGNYDFAAYSKLGASVIIDSDNNGTTGKFFIGKDSSDPDSAVHLLTVQEDGNVGIGVTAPGSKLEVGTNTLGSGYKSSFSVLASGYMAAGGSKLVYVGGDGTNAFIQAMDYGVPAAMDLAIQANGGNVGIGTTGPLGRLDVRHTNILDTSSAGNLFLGTSDSMAVNKGGKLTFGGNYTGTTPTGWASIAGRKENASDANYAGYLSFATRAAGSSPAEVMRITSTGSVGIGVAAPQAKLNIISATSPTINDLMFTFNSAGDYRSGIANVFAAGTPSANYMNLRISDGTTTGQTTAMTLRGDGNVGIGINPNYKLHVNGNILAEDWSYAEFFSSTGGSQANPSYSNNSGTTGMYFPSNNIAFSFAGSEKIRFDTNGNVGIATTIPLTKLQVGLDNASEPITLGTLTPELLVMGATTNTTEDSLMRLVRPAYSGNLYPASVDFKVKSFGALGAPYNAKTQLTLGLKDNASYDTGVVVDVMTLRSDGTVGIGTAAPGTKLHVISGSDGRFDGIRVSPSDYGTTGAYLTINKNTGTGPGIIQAGDSGAYRDIAINADGGNVGIGTASPGSYKLNVNGTINAGGNYLYFGNGGYIRNITSPYAALTLNVNVMGRDATDQFMYYAGDSNLTGAYMLMYGGSHASSAGQMAFTATKYTFNTGNVGIGVDAGTYKLNVNGNTYLNGNVTITGTCTGCGSGSSQWTTSGSNIYYNSTGNVGIGVNPTDGKLHTLASGGYNNTYFDAYADIGASVMMFRRARGTSGAPTAIDGVRQLGYIGFQGWDGTSFQTGATISSNSEGVFNGTTRTSNLLFQTVSGTTTNNAMTITGAGNVGIGVTPSYKLDVSGEGRFTGNTYFDGGTYYKDKNAAVDSWWGFYAFDKNLEFNKRDSSNVFVNNIFTANWDTSVLTLTPTVGNVVVGSGSTPGINANLKVINSSSAYINVKSSTNPEVFLGSDSSTYGIVGTYSDHPLGFRANNLLKLSVDNVTGTQLTTQGSNSTYGSLTIKGDKNSYVGINFKSAAGNNWPTLMFNGDNGGLYNSAVNGWLWYWVGSTLSHGTVPWGNVGSIPGQVSSLNQYVNTNSNVEFGSVYTDSYINDCPGGWSCDVGGWDATLVSIIYTGLQQRSDIRLKKDINGMDFDQMSNRLLQLRPVTYKWKDEKISQNTKFGLIAQEVQPIWPEMVEVGSNEERTLSLDYTQFISPLISVAQKYLMERPVISQDIQDLQNSLGFEFVGAGSLEEGDLAAFDSDASDTIKTASDSDNFVGAYQLIGINKTPKIVTSGRVVLKVSAENGAIKQGDKLMISKNRPGTAVKATGMGQIIGTALENFDQSEIGKINCYLQEYSYLGRKDSSGTFEIVGDLLIGKENDGDTFNKLTINSEIILNADMLVSGSILPNVDKAITLGSNIHSFESLFVKNVYAAALIGGNWSLDETGLLATKEIATDKLKITGDKTVGFGRIKQGTSDVIIPNMNVTDKSMIFVTFLTNTEGRTYFIAEKIAGQDFKVALSQPAAVDTDFQYWIVESDLDYAAFVQSQLPPPAENFAPAVSPAVEEPLATESGPEDGGAVAAAAVEVPDAPELSATSVQQE